MRVGLALGCAIGTLAAPVAPVLAQSSNLQSLSAELAEARAQIEQQKRALEAQEARLQALEARVQTVAAAVNTSPTPASPNVQVASNTASSRAPSGIELVGEAPVEIEMPQVAVLGDQGSIVTRAGQFTAETSLEYARADRNRALFRGIEIVESVLIGLFDINESRQDVLTATAGLRYGVSNRLEIGARLPYIYRSDTSILAPIAGDASGGGDDASPATTNGNGIGDIELSARYQLLSARAGRPFLIGNLQVVAPTGSSPFEVPRDSRGRQTEAATGAGFWAVAPSITAILPSDPAVLFGTIGYTHNFGRNVDTVIGPVQIDRVEPGDSLSGSFGLGVSLNQRTSFNLGYAHSWVFGTKTTTSQIEPGANDPGPVTATSRDLQLGRLLFGVTYRLNNRANLNWAFEVGATEDATDLRTVIRIPIVL